MTFRRRRRVNWLLVLIILIGLAGAGYLLYQRLGMPKAVQELPIFPKPTPTNTPTIDDGAAALTRADTLFAEGKLDQAAEQYALAVSITEKASQDFALLADRLTAAGNSTEAAARKTDAQNATLRTATAYTRWCKILALRGKGSDAIVLCNKAIELNNRSAEAYAFLALAYDRNNEYDKAISAALRANDLDAAYAEGYAFLAEAYADQKPFEKRNLETAQKAVKVNDQSGFAHRTLGWVYETQGEYRLAAQHYTTATLLMPTLSYFHLDLCRMQRVRKLMEEAVTACRKATELDPQNAEAHDRLGLVYYDQQDNEKALAAFQKATEADPTYAQAYGHQGWVYYFRLFGWEKAVAAFQKAIDLGTGKLAPGTLAEYYTEMGWSYYKLNRCGDARPAFDRALGLLARAPDPNIMAQAQQGLQACEGRK